MNCMNCQNPVAETDVMFFLNVFLCKVCGQAANEFRDRAKSELEASLAYLDTAVQMALKDPAFRMKSELPVDMPKFGVARLATDLCVRVQEKSCLDKSRLEPTPSITSSSPPALGTGAQELSDSQSPSAVD